MIVDRNKQSELLILAMFWVLAVMIQLVICNTIVSYIGQHFIKDDFVASSQFQAWGASIITDTLSWGGLFGLLCGWGAFRLEGQIDLETAVCLTGLVALFLGAIPLIVGMGHTNWRYPIFFVECAPLCALIWRSLYLGLVWFGNWKANRAEKAKDLKGDIKAIKVEDNFEAQAPEKVLVEEAKEPKKEEKSIERKPVLPEEPSQKSTWRID